MNSDPNGITEGPDGNMWFTETAAGAIGMVNVNSLIDPTNTRRHSDRRSDPGADRRRAQ